MSQRRPPVQVHLLDLRRERQKSEVSGSRGGRQDATGYHLVRGASQQRGHVIQHALHHQEGLRYAKAPEGGVGGQVGPAGGAAAAQVGDIVGVVRVEQHLLRHLEEEEEENQHLSSSQRAEEDKKVATNQVGFVESVSSVDRELKICSHDAAVVHETHLGRNFSIISNIGCVRTR